MTDLQYPLSANIGRHIRSKWNGSEGEIIGVKGFTFLVRFADGSRPVNSICMAVNYEFVTPADGPATENVVSIVPLINRKRIAVVSVGGPDDGPRVA